jgi:hypothetical protein
MNALQIHLFMQNKPNFLDEQMNLSSFITMDYEQRTMNYEIKTKPKQTQYKANTNPIQSQYEPNTNPIQTQTNPISETKQSSFNKRQRAQNSNLRPPGYELPDREHSQFQTDITPISSIWI